MVVGIDAFVAYVNVALREDEEHEGLAYYINEKATPIPVSSCQFSFAQERRTNFFILPVLFINRTMYCLVVSDFHKLPI